MQYEIDYTSLHKNQARIKVEVPIEGGTRHETIGEISLGYLNDWAAYSDKGTWLGGYPTPGQAADMVLADYQRKITYTKPAPYETPTPTPYQILRSEGNLKTFVAVGNLILGEIEPFIQDQGFNIFYYRSFGYEALGVEETEAEAAEALYLHGYAANLIPKP